MPSDHPTLIAEILADSLRVKRAAVEAGAATLVAAAEMTAEALRSGHKVLFFGNGGSAADAQHLAAEFVNRFRIERPPLAAVALTTDTSILTSIGNDYSFEEVFAKQVLALGRAGDVACGISTSGNSPNVVKAARAARTGGLRTIAMTGRGGALAECCELVLKVDSPVTARIQESHITFGHILCELVDRILFPEAHPA
jgi:D-sedoheptulose 7-phosphate isomerase